MKYAKAGFRIGDISGAIQDYAESFGYSLVRELVGHGVGRELHEDPQVPNFRTKRKGIRLEPGMTLAIEPMVNMGKDDIFIDEEDDWTVYTEDGSLSAQWEITVLVTETGYEILTY